MQVAGEVIGWEWKDILGVLIAAVAVAVSAATTYFSYITAERQRLIASATLFTTLANTYDSPEMRLRRQRFAKMLAQPLRREKIDLYSENSVLDFFEEIGYLVRKQVLDEEMAWNHFFWPFERYYRAVTKPSDLITTARETHNFPTLYTETQWLFDRLLKLRERSTGRKYKLPTEDDVSIFLESEMALGTVDVT